MAVKITVHRGTNQIGGSIVEIATDTAYLFIDFGTELSREKGRPTDAEMILMMKERVRKAADDGKQVAIFFTHIHGDHIGLLDKLPINDEFNRPVKLAMGANAKKCYFNIHSTLAEKGEEKEKAKHKKILDILKNGEWLAFENGKEEKIGDIKITPISVDHSAFDSYMFIIETEGKCIVHTGDFRTHGRLGEHFFERLKGHLEGKTPDVLITEGTMLSRKPEVSDNETVIAETEPQLQDKAEKLLDDNKCVFAVCSSTNVESLASFYNAMITANEGKDEYQNRKFYVNSYVRKQLKTFNEVDSIPELKFDMSIVENIPPLSNDDKDPEKEKKIQETVDRMKEKGFVMLITNPHDYYRDSVVKRFISEGANPLLIYSMWSGYLEEPYSEDKDKKAYNELWKMFDSSRRKKLHTSGHAYPDIIKKMIDTVNPTKAIIPIHTEKMKQFKDLLEKNDSRLKLLSDGWSYNLDSGKTEKRKEKTLQEIADMAAGELTENTGWEERYGGYYKCITESEKYVRAVCKCFCSKSNTSSEYDPLNLYPLTKYTSVGRVRDTNVTEGGYGIVKIDLRIWGISVAEITVKIEKNKGLEKEKKITDRTEIKNNSTVKFRKSAVDKVLELLPDRKDKDKLKELVKVTEKGEKPDIETHIIFTKKGDKYVSESYPLTSGVFKSFKELLNDKRPSKIEEHPVETELLRMLNDPKDWHQNLKLCKLADQFYQLCTPLSASEAKSDILYYSKDELDRDRKGGGIDILARAKGKLCVIELKDTYDKNEPPEKAIKQAIAYAAFIIRLIRSKKANGEKWCKLFGIEPPGSGELTVNALIAMPYPDENKGSASLDEEIDKSFIKESPVKLGEDLIQLHYMYFKKETFENPNVDDGFCFSDFI